MDVHRNARLTSKSREAMVPTVVEGGAVSASCRRSTRQRHVRATPCDIIHIGIKKLVRFNAIVDRTLALDELLQEKRS